MESKEFNIPVPWGHLAAKAWGSSTNPHVLMFHGIWDNVGTFDRLVSQLPKKHYYVGVDFPGHGKSSHFPYGVPMYTLNIITIFKVIVDYFNKGPYIVIGHSWGGQMSFLFTQLYPEHVIKLIILDTVVLYPVSRDFFKDYMRDHFQQMFQVNKNMFESNKKQPTFTYEDALHRIQYGRLYGEITREAAEALLNRQLVPTEDGKFKFTIDLRIRSFINLFYGHHYITALIKKYPISCPVLFVMADDSVNVLKYFEKIVKEVQKTNTQCFIRRVKGNHDVHNSYPERVAPIVSTFLSHTSNSKL